MPSAASGTSAASVGSGRRAAYWAGAALAAAALFAVYLRESWTVGVSSDGGAITLQAWDMLHGNLLLHGWAMSDVSFYSTELPQYMLLEWLHGLSPGLLHAGGAMTYTIVLVLAALVAKGRATGREAALRVAIAAGIMLAPAEGFASSTLLLTPDHLGSSVPILLAWLVIDRSAPRARVPVLVGVLLAWGLVADRLIEVTMVIPLVVVALIRTGQRALRRSGDARPWWYEPSLAAAALAAVAAADLAGTLIRAAGGFALRPVGTRFAGAAQLPHNALLTVQGVAMLFGATFDRGQPVNLFFSSLHLTGLLLAVIAFGLALTRLLRRDERRDELLVPALALAIAANLVLYVHGRYAQNLLSSREITEVLPFGAVLAGRLLAGPLLTGWASRARIRGRNVVLPVLAVALAGYAVSLAAYAARPVVPARNQDLANWLVAHHLTGGLATSYWMSDITTTDSGGRSAVRQVRVLRSGRLAVPDTGWGYDRDWYQPRSHRAEFVVTNAAPGSAAWRSVLNSARRTFGRPARTYSYQQYTVLVWDSNLLRSLA